MRIRVLALPNERFILVLDRYRLGWPADSDTIRSWVEDFKELTGAALVLIGSDDVEMDGTPVELAPEVVERIAAAVA